MSEAVEYYIAANSVAAAFNRAYYNKIFKPIENKDAEHYRKTYEREYPAALADEVAYMGCARVRYFAGDAEHCPDAEADCNKQQHRKYPAEFFLFGAFYISVEVFNIHVVGIFCADFFFGGVFFRGSFHNGVFFRGRGFFGEIVLVFLHYSSFKIQRISTALMRFTPAETFSCLAILNVPKSPVCSACGPPQISRENSPME